MENTAKADFPTTFNQLTHSAGSHRPEVLLGKLRGLGIVLTPDLAKRMTRFDWTTDLRYEIGRRDFGETRGVLRTAKFICDWVKEQLP